MRCLLSLFWPFVFFILFSSTNGGVFGQFFRWDKDMIHVLLAPSIRPCDKKCTPCKIKLSLQLIHIIRGLSPWQENERICRNVNYLRRNWSIKILSMGYFNNFGSLWDTLFSKYKITYLLNSCLFRTLELHSFVQASRPNMFAYFGHITKAHL